MTITTLSIASDILGGLANFFDVVVDYLQAFLLVTTNLLSNVAMLIRFAWNWFTIPAFLSAYFIYPIAISGGFMVLVGLVKLLYGRDSQ